MSTTLTTTWEQLPSKIRKGIKRRKVTRPYTWEEVTKTLKECTWSLDLPIRISMMIWEVYVEDDLKKVYQPFDYSDYIDLFQRPTDEG